MSLSSAKLRSLSHKVLSATECQQLKVAIQSFRESHSVFSFCCSLKVILDTNEKMQILMVLHSMVPEDLLSDFDSLCCIHFDYYKKVLQPKIQENLQKKQKRSPQNVTDKKPVSRHGSVLEPAKGTIHSGIREKKDRRRTRSMEGNLDSAHLHSSQRVPGKKDKKGEDQERREERKRSKTAHVELLRAMSTSDQPLATSQGQGSSGRSTSIQPPVTNQGQGSSKSSRTTQNVRMRKVRLENRPGESLGFCIRGGKDLHAGIYISSIDSGGQAENKGLKVGERILRVNETSLKNVTHAEAVVAIKSTVKLTLYLAQCGQMPGTPSGTPRSQESMRSADKKEAVSSDGMRVVLLVADNDGFLGCSIRGGIDYALPVTVASIDPLSPAHKAGLKRGELVLKVNGEDITGMSHLDVVDLMTTSNVVKMLVMPNLNRVKRRSSSHTSDLRRSPRLQNDPNQGKSSTLCTRKSSHAAHSPSTPIRIRRRPADISAFEQELHATPPRSTSTPVPNEGNRNEPLNESLFSSDRSLYTSHNHPIPKLNFQEPYQGNVNTSGGSSVENVAPQEEEKMKEFDNGTIRLNMNSKEKLSLRGVKIVDINVDGGNIEDRRRRESVKNIFSSRDQLSDKEENINDDVVMETLQSEDINRNRSPKPSNRNQHEHLNVLSSPHQSYNSLHVSGKVSPLLLPLQNIGVSTGDQTPPNGPASKQKKKSRLSLAARIFSKKRPRGSISSGTSAYSSSESLDTMVEGRQLPSVDVISNTQDWLMY